MKKKKLERIEVFKQRGMVVDNLKPHDFFGTISYDGKFHFTPKPIIPNFFPIVAQNSDNFEPEEISKYAKIGNEIQIDKEIDTCLRGDKCLHLLMKCLGPEKYIVCTNSQVVHFFGILLKPDYFDGEYVKFVQSKNQKTFSLKFSENIHKITVQGDFLYFGCRSYIYAIKIEDGQKNCDEFIKFIDELEIEEPVATKTIQNSSQKQKKRKKVNKSSDITETSAIENDKKSNPITLVENSQIEQTKDESIQQNTSDNREIIINNQDTFGIEEKYLQSLDFMKKKPKNDADQEVILPYNKEYVRIFFRKNETFCVNTVSKPAIFFLNTFKYYSINKKKFAFAFDNPISFMIAAPHPNEFYMVQNRRFFLFNCEEKKITNLATFSSRPTIVEKWENGLVFLVHGSIHIYNHLTYKDKDSIASIYHGCRYLPHLSINNMFFIVHDVSGDFLFIQKSNLSCCRVKYKFENFENFCSSGNTYHFMFKDAVITFQGEEMNFDLQAKIREFREIALKNNEKVFFRHENVSILFRNHGKRLLTTIPKSIKRPIYVDIEDCYELYFKKKPHCVYFTTSYLFNELNGEKDAEEKKQETKNQQNLGFNSQK